MMTGTTRFLPTYPTIPHILYAPYFGRGPKVRNESRKTLRRARQAREFRHYSLPEQDNFSHRIGEVRLVL